MAMLEVDEEEETRAQIASFQQGQGVSAHALGEQLRRRPTGRQKSHALGSHGYLLWRRRLSQKRHSSRGERAGDGESAGGAATMGWRRPMPSRLLPPRRAAGADCLVGPAAVLDKERLSFECDAGSGQQQLVTLTNTGPPYVCM